MLGFNKRPQQMKIELLAENPIERTTWFQFSGPNLPNSMLMALPLNEIMEVLTAHCEANDIPYRRYP